MFYRYSFIDSVLSHNDIMNVTRTVFGNITVTVHTIFTLNISINQLLTILALKFDPVYFLTNLYVSKWLDKRQTVLLRCHILIWSYTDCSDQSVCSITRVKYGQANCVFILNSGDQKAVGATPTRSAKGKFFRGD